MRTEKRRAMRGHRLLRASALTAAGCAVVAGAGLSALPAAAATTPIAVTTAGGDGQVSAAWGTVPGATGYVVHWGAGTDTGRTVTTTGTSVAISGVTNLRNYSIRVSAVGAQASSPVLTAVPRANTPSKLTSVHAEAAGPNQVRVTWTGGGPARQVAVIAGANSTTSVNHFGSPWYPAAVHAVTLTVPARLRAALGAGTGNPVFVKVVQSNARAADPAKQLGFSLSAKYRPLAYEAGNGTAGGVWALAGAPVVDEPVTRLAVASLNVQSLPASSGMSPVNRWLSRLPRIVRTVEAARPALIGFQELDTARSTTGCHVHHENGQWVYCPEQYNDLEAALATRSAAVPVPYRIADPTANAAVWAEQQTGQRAVIDSQLFYDPARLAVVRTGFISPDLDLKVPGYDAVTGGDRLGAWGVFRTLVNGQPVGRAFLAATIHLPAGDTAAAAAARKAEADLLGPWLDAKALQADGTSLPIVLTGDFNSFGAWDPQAGNLSFVRQGWFDAAATPNRSVAGMRLSTANATNGAGGVDDGYPDRLVMHQYPTSRIDYILVKGSPHTYAYANVVHTAGGVFVKDYQGSDHNLQLATIGIADPKVHG
ncbi:endonuclease/exonuclease/phosphatase family protein [Amnibacterium sp. CER49]|uniref:endonuclease/exonuclease/phosphatase family protein n=1 Tax=Amnibacterium sp. CER49 TaxID=3039161 RepID=UPI002448499E|nr:endonuclease/exonuclease/phosphatase family protein [Amnibacterium sp. CER49]MDH2442873.1 endonuclease/exonuclease/phosphatase family protein [Amnibacterium sp. CER49]